METSELTGTALDYVVAKCEGWTDTYCGAPCHCLQHRNSEGEAKTLPKYSTDWAQGGPIIERNRIHLRPIKGCEWEAYAGQFGGEGKGATPLEAAMRCYCCDILGDDIEIPEELI